MIGDALAFVFYLALLYLLVKPGSAATEFVQQFSTALTAIIANATDLSRSEDVQEGNDNE